MKNIINLVGMCIANVLRWYTVFFPIRIGKGILSQIEMKIISKCVSDILTHSADGRKFLLKMPEDKIRLTIFTYGYCEKHLTKYFENIIKKDDYILDIGANIGWYTTLFAKKTKYCHAFEPNTLVYNRLINNCQLNGVLGNCRLNKCALGNKQGVVNFYNFKDLHHGLSSLSDFNRSDVIESKVKITTLSKYVEENEIPRIDLIKVDVEGSELSVLEGFEEKLEEGFLPIWSFELNKETSSAFNYKPEDLLIKLSKYNYCFYLVRKKLIKLTDFSSYKNGDIVICVIPEIHKDRLDNLLNSVI